METVTLCHADTFKAIHRAMVIGSGEDHRGPYLRLSSTLFHPQGGGQESDRGSIFCAAAELPIRNVRWHQDEIRHYAVFKPGVTPLSLQGQSVSIEIDLSWRLGSARLHTAGHLIAEMARLAMPGWAPLKGHHFREGSYVEFSGCLDIPGELMRGRLEEEIRHAIASDLPVVAHSRPPSSLRLVTIAGFEGALCGGTHLDRPGQMGPVAIRKVRESAGTIRVSYLAE